MIPSEKWAGRFMDMAKLVGSWSRDPSSKVGAVIAKDKRVISMGFNGFPAGTRDDDDLYENRERKYLRVVHAEKNAILFAKQDLKDCTIYATHFPCCQCAAFIIQSGITQVVTLPQPMEFVSRWYNHMYEALCMFGDANVACFTYTPDTGNITRFLLFNPENIEDY